MILKVTEVSGDVLRDLKVVDGIIGSSMEGYNIWYVNSCIELGICNVLIASLDDKVVGVGVYYIVNTSPERVGVIYYVVVDRRYRGLGIGKSLIASIEEMLESDKVSIYLATTREGNKVVRKLLTSFGYFEIPLDVGVLGEVLEVIERITCGYDDDLLFIKTSQDTVKTLNSLITKLGFLTRQDNIEVINRLWRKICYEVWLRSRRLRG